MSYQHCNGKHDLVRVMTKPAGEPGVDYVTRWCQNCGAIVIDADVDGRTQPGAGSSMAFPRIAQTTARGVNPSHGRNDA